MHEEIGTEERALMHEQQPYDGLFLLSHVFLSSYRFVKPQQECRS